MNPACLTRLDRFRTEPMPFTPHGATGPPGLAATAKSWASLAWFCRTCAAEKCRSPRWRTRNCRCWGSRSRSRAGRPARAPAVADEDVAPSAGSRSRSHRSCRARASGVPRPSAVSCWRLRESAPGFSSPAALSTATEESDDLVAVREVAQRGRLRLMPPLSAQQTDAACGVTPQILTDMPENGDVEDRIIGGIDHVATRAILCDTSSCLDD